MKIFKHKYSDLFMCFSFLITFLVLFIVLSYVEAIRNFNSDLENSAYKSECTFSFTIGDGNIDFDRLFENVGGVECIEEVVVSVDAVKKEYAACVIMNADEPVMYSAGYREIDEKQIREEEYPVVLGMDFSALISEENGFSIDSVTYKLIGVEEGYRSELYDKRILLWYDKIGKFTKQHIDEQGVYTVKICSNVQSAESIFNKIQENARVVCPGSRLDLLPSDNTVDYVGEEKEITVYYLLIYLFCIINCTIAAQFWVFERKREIAIRRAYGFSEQQLFGALYADFTKLALLSMALCICTKIIADIIGTGSSFGFNISFFNIIFLLISVAITSFLAIILPIVSIGRTASVNSMIRKNHNG